MQQKNQEEIVKDYEEKSNEILKRMMQIVVRAQRKIDDEAYRNVLKRVESDNNL